MNDRMTPAPDQGLPAPLLAELQTRFGPRFSTAAAVREQHGRDESSFVDVNPPDAVVFAEDVADVQALLALAGRYAVPVIPFGAGSSLEGHLLAVRGGISLDVSRMNRVLAIDTADMTATVQPGVTRMQLPPTGPSRATVNIPYSSASRRASSTLASNVVRPRRRNDVTAP